MTRSARRRILAIDLASRGFGFVVLEGSDRLVDWGTRDAREQKHAGTLRKIAALIEIYVPDVVVLEDCDAPGSRRTSRIRCLATAVAGLGREMGVTTRVISSRRVGKAFASASAATKYEIARQLAEKLPEMASVLPRKRKPWQSEDIRTRMFGALAMGTSYLAMRRGIQQETRPFVTLMKGPGLGRGGIDDGG